MASFIICLLSACVLTTNALQSSHLKNRSLMRQLSKFKIMSIAPYKKPRAQNVPGNLFVDEGYCSYSSKQPMMKDDEGIVSHTISKSLSLTSHFLSISLEQISRYQVVLTVMCADGCVHLSMRERVSRQLSSVSQWRRYYLNPRLNVDLSLSS